MPLSLSQADDLMWDAWIIIDKETDINNSNSSSSSGSSIRIRDGCMCSLLIKSDKWIFVFVSLLLLLLFSLSLFCRFAISLDFYVLFMTLMFANIVQRTIFPCIQIRAAEWSLESELSFRSFDGCFSPLFNVLECLFTYRVCSLLFIVSKHINALLIYPYRGLSSPRFAFW